MNSECPKDIVYLTLIAGRKQKDALLTEIAKEGGRLINTVYGNGTVKAGYLMNAFGLVYEENKVVISCLISRAKVDSVFKMLNEKFNFHKPNTGIAFTMTVKKISF